MSELYCIYKNEKYQAEIKNGMVEVASSIPREGFEEYIDVIGRRHNDLFTKKINVDELDYVYKEDILIKYKDVYFQLFADKISRSAVFDNSYMIWTDSEQLAQEYTFEKKEQFVFIKYITREEIEAVKIVKKPILEFKDKETTEEILESDKLDNWLFELI